MSDRNALTLSIGFFGAVAVWLTAELVTVPVWVVFIAWASFAVVGGGVGGLIRSAACNLTGMLIGAACLLLAQLAHGNSWLTGATVGLGSALMVAVSRIGLLSAVPAIVWGFASMVGTAAVTGRAVTYTASAGNPVLLAATAVLLGAGFGFCAERLARVLTTGRAAGEASA
jgi:hypothetical protein